MLHICKNCFNSYNGKPEVCPHCGVELSKKVKPNSKEDNLAQDNLNPNSSYKKQNTKSKHHKRRRISSAEIMESINFEDLLKKTDDKSVNSWRELKRKEKRPEFSVKNGELDINTSDVTYLPQTYTYSAKKARGEYTKPSIKWWEIYKWADLMLAKRKVKKQVKKASYYRPPQIKASTMGILCFLFGYIGIHNYYARNYRKGIVSTFCCIMGLIIIFTKNWFFNSIKLSLGGGLMFVAVTMWAADFINICMGKYKYRLSKWRFIDCLNVDSRAKLGYKYVEKEEYKKLWIVRLVNKIKKSIATSKQKREVKKVS